MTTVGETPLFCAMAGLITLCVSRGQLWGVVLCETTSIVKKSMLFIHVSVTMSLRMKVKTWNSLEVFHEVYFHCYVRGQTVTDQGEWAPKCDATVNLSISTKTKEAARKFKKDNSILLMHEKALELWERRLVSPQARGCNVIMLITVKPLSGN